MREFPSSAQHAASSALGGVTPIDSRTRQTFIRVAMAVVVLEPLVIAGVLIVVGVPWEIVVLLMAGLIGFTALVFWLLVVVLWKPLQRRYPPQAFLPGAVSQSWQSFAFGPLARLNNCLTIVADEKHLHIRPFILMQWLGAGWVSLPLDRMRDVRPGLLGMQMIADLDGRTVAGPAWCLRLAVGTLNDDLANNPAGGNL